MKVNDVDKIGGRQVAPLALEKDIPSLLVVSVEAPWPATHGGRIRTMKLVEALARHWKVTVAFPGMSADLEAAEDALAHRPTTGNITLVLLPAPNPRRYKIRGRLSLKPNLGVTHLSGSRATLLALLSSGRFRTVVWSHSYLSAVGVRWSRTVCEATHVVDFANIEAERFASISKSGGLTRRISAFVESLKARVWEPRLARSVDLCLALSLADFKQIKGWGAKVVLALNGVDKKPQNLSPENAKVLVAGNWEYAPNRDSLRGFLAEQWPLVIAHRPDAEIHIFGKGADDFEADVLSGIYSHGFVDDLEPYYAAASIVLAPASSGGGSQLKVAEALAFGRVVVGPMYLAREYRPGLPKGAIVPSASIARTILYLWEDSDYRHRIEHSIGKFAELNSWENQFRIAVYEIAHIMTKY